MKNTPTIQAGERTQVEQDYIDGKWVPSYYGLKFTVANRNRKGGEQDPAFRAATFSEACAEATRRNQAGAFPEVLAMVEPWLSGDAEHDAQSLRRRFRMVGLTIGQWRDVIRVAMTHSTLMMSRL